MEDRRKTNVKVNVERRSIFEEKQVDVMLNTMSIMIIITHFEDILYANTAFYHTTKYTENDIKTLKISDLMTNENRNFLVERSKRRLMGDTTLPNVYLDLEFVKKSGEIFTLNLYPGLINYEGKKCVIYSGIDTTAQRKVEKSLNGFFDYCPLPAYISDKNRRMIKCTPFYEQSLKKSALEIIGKTTDELFDKEHAEKIKQEDDIIFTQKKHLTIDEVFGDKHYVKIKFPINGDLIGGFCIDITDRKKTEENLKKLSQAIEQSPVSVVITNIDGNIEYVNPKFLSLTGYNADEVIGENPRILKSGYQSDSIYTELWETVLKGDVWVGELHNKKKNGDLYWESATIAPIKNENGIITHLIGVKEDITDRKIYEESLEKTNIQLKNLYDLTSSVLDMNPNMIWVYNKHTNMKFFNKQLRDFPLDLNVLETSASLVEKEKQCIKSIKINDEQRYLEFKTKPLYDQEGVIIGSTGTVTDITDDYNRQNKIVEKLEKIEEISIKNANDVIKDLNKTITLLDKRWEENGRKK